MPDQVGSDPPVQYLLGILLTLIEGAVLPSLQTADFMEASQQEIAKKVRGGKQAIHQHRECLDTFSSGPRQHPQTDGKFIFRGLESTPGQAAAGVGDRRLLVGFPLFAGKMILEIMGILSLGIDQQRG